MGWPIWILVIILWTMGMRRSNQLQKQMDWLETELSKRHSDRWLREDIEKLENEMADIRKALKKAPPKEE